MFQFSGFAHLSVYYVFNIVGCPIQVSTDHTMCARPRSFSQLITPFIASESQGIPHTPLFCLLYFCIIVINYASTLFFLLFKYFYLNMSKIVPAWHAIGVMPSVENNGFEPLTPCLQSRCSSQLS